MQTFLITGITDPAGDSYDEEQPTRQTELLSLSLRNLLYNLQDAGMSLKEEPEEAEETAYAEILNEAVSEVTTANMTLSDARDAMGGLESNLPAIPPAPDFITILLPLLPALLRGTIGLPALIPVLLPTILRLVLNKGFNDLFNGDNGNLADIGGKLDEIRDAISTNTESIIEGYNSCSDAIAELQELKQICIMKTSEIDKVIFQEPI